MFSQSRLLTFPLLARGSRGRWLGIITSSAQLQLVRAGATPSILESRGLRGVCEAQTLFIIAISHVEYVLNIVVIYV